jgi:hypothetical protein
MVKLRVKHQPRILPKAGYNSSPLGRSTRVAYQKGDGEVEANQHCELTVLMRDTANSLLGQLTMRVCSGVPGFFGWDSNQYEQAGACARQSAFGKSV